MSNLDHYSEEDLKNELKRREDERQRQIRLKKEANAEFWLSHIDSLLDIVPNHCRTSCNDNNLANYDRCTRCFLLDAQQTNHWDLEKELHVYIS
jgi:hypothetical protein